MYGYTFEFSLARRSQERDQLQSRKCNGKSRQEFSSYVNNLKAQQRAHNEESIERCKGLFFTLLAVPPGMRS